MDLRVSRQTGAQPAPKKENGLEVSEEASESSTPNRDWSSVIDTLNTFLSTLQQNFVPPVLIRKILTQIFAYINVQMFNSLLQRQECCTFSNGEYINSGLDELQIWCSQAKEEFAGSSWDELKHIRQASGFLVINQKSRISYDEIINDLCPILSVKQLYKICMLYWDDNFNTSNVSEEVISSMKEQLMKEDFDTTDSETTEISLLLEEDSRTLFSADDITNCMHERDFTDVKTSEELLDKPTFQFLRE